MKRSWFPVSMAPALLAVAGSVQAGPSGPVEPWIGEWSVVRTASVRVHHEIGHPVDPARLRGLENTVRRLAAELGLGLDQLEELRRDPIEYLYVRDAAQLRWFGVNDVDGMALVGERKILASRLPHEHELVHVLAQIAIEPAFEHNQPFLQEGLASYLGGHLGEAPAAVLATGDRVLDRHPGLMGELLTVEGFRESPLPSPACYAASARFMEYLDRARGGRGRILELLKLLAGREEEVVQRPVSIVETQLEGVYQTGFQRLLGEFDAWRQAHPPSGILPSGVPVRPEDLRLADADHVVRLWREADGWIIAARPLHDEVDLALTWGEPSSSRNRLTAPVRASGYELWLDAEGGRLVSHRAPAVLLRWYRGSSERVSGTEEAWFLPADALEGVPMPTQALGTALWSQPRFHVD